MLEKTKVADYIVSTDPNTGPELDTFDDISFDDLQQIPEFNCWCWVAVITTILDEDDMSSDSDALITQ